MRFLEVPPRQAEVIAEADVVVAGGGPAGLGAALAAAREGARVVLLERYGFLGGNFTAAAVGTICGLYVRNSPGEFDFVAGGFARHLAEELAANGAGIGPMPFKDTAVMLYVPWAVKRLTDHLVTEARITLFLHALVSDVVLDESGAVAGLVVASKQGPQAVLAKVVVDATGDADVAVATGVPVEMGPAGRRQFGAMQFFVQHADTQAALAAGLAVLQEAVDSHGGHLTRDSGAVVPTFRPGEMIGAMIRLGRDGAPLDATDLADLTYGEIEGRRRAEEAMGFLKAHMPGFEEAFLADTAVQQGVRETRHIRGLATLTGDDVTGCARFDDAVAASAWPQEYHVSGRGTEMIPLPDGASYQIPYRALVPQGPSGPLSGGQGPSGPLSGGQGPSGPLSGQQGLTNLLVAGRCVSADHDALASCRVMAPCMAMGEAAGTAAAMAAAEGTPVAGIDVSALQETLRAAGAILGT